MERPRRIMIVEDSHTQALKLQIVLEQQGWQAVWAADAAAAMEEIDRGAPDLILVDYHLPGIRGDELCRKIRMNINTRGIPIIMLTADGESESEIRGLESGADDFMAKSSDTDILLLRIRTWLSKSESQSAIFERTDSCFQRARLLTIDDSETFLEYLDQELTNEGYQVEKAKSPKEGIQRLAQEAFDCVLVDLVMPEIDGIEVCREITKLRRDIDNPIAVLMLTGCENKEELTRALEAGADDFVGKSSDLAVLKGRIRALLRRKFYQEENQRILEELRDKQLEAMRATAEKEAAETRAELERQRQALKMMAEISKTKEELEKSNEELKRSNDELKQFAYVASHDLQEPLRTVASFCELIQQTYEGNLDERADRWIKKVVSGVRRMKSMIQDLLTYSRVERLDDHFATISLDAVCDEAIVNLSTCIEESKVIITRDELPTLDADSTQMLHLLQNLIGNAIKYQGGEPPRIHISARQDNGQYIFSIQDNGIGIEPQYFQRIFEIFKRLHGKDKYTGTGIGLALCQRIVHRHGGRIWVDSELGTGSTFYFTIPHKIMTQQPNDSQILAIQST